MSNTPWSPARQSSGPVQTWVSSQWKFLPSQGQFSTAINTLGIMYVTGTGVPQNYVEAYKWWVIAASEGVQEPADNRDRVRAYMTPAQIAEAEKLAAEWKPKK